MNTVITARHCEINEDLRERTQAVLERLAVTGNRAIDAAAVFDAVGTARTAELRVHLSHGDVVIGHGAAPDHRSALDQAEGRIRRQLSRIAGRLRTGRHKEPPGSA